VQRRRYKQELRIPGRIAKTRNPVVIAKEARLRYLSRKKVHAAGAARKRKPRCERCEKTNNPFNPPNPRTKPIFELREKKKSVKSAQSDDNKYPDDKWKGKDFRPGVK